MKTTQSTHQPWGVLYTKEGLAHVFGHYPRRSDAETVAQSLRRKLANCEITVFWDAPEEA